MSEDVKYYCACCKAEVTFDEGPEDTIDCPHCLEECEVETDQDREDKKNEAYLDTLIEERTLEGRI